MKVKLFLLTLCFLPNFIFAQYSARIVDSMTREPIPYVNIQVKDALLGTISDDNGLFAFDSLGFDKSLVFSAVGYNPKVVHISQWTNIIELSPSAYTLQEVEIRAAKIKTLSTGKLNKKVFDGSYRSFEKYPLMIGRYMPYDTIYAETPYLKKINFLTINNFGNGKAKFNVRLYRIAEDGSPGEFLYNENIYGYAKKGTRITEVDISDLYIRFPEEGFFIFVDWLGVKSNLAKINMSFAKADGKVYRREAPIKVEPNFAYDNKNIADYWVYRGGFFSQYKKDTVTNLLYEISEDMPDYHLFFDDYGLFGVCRGHFDKGRLMVELILSN